MEWNQIISPQRTGYHKKIDNHIRTDFQRDYDRLVFSSAFRRLQNKTQIFALPGSVFVHNRLTHSLETASVGRSLGKDIGSRLIQKGLIDTDNKEFYQYELQNIIAAACLSHDIGNPPFGHSGEEAISNFFLKNDVLMIEGKKLIDFYSTSEWSDITHFEGNANSFRILTHQFLGKPEGGFRLTYTTLAAMIKYPCSSDAAYEINNTNGVNTSEKIKQNKTIHNKKYSFFHEDAPLAIHIMKELSMIEASQKPTQYLRHPFVYLTEAADDICYRIVDFEDAHRLNILSYQEVETLFIQLIQSLQPKKIIDNTEQLLKKIGDDNEKISFLRAKVINLLTVKSVEIFMEFQNKIISGKFNQGLVDYLENYYPSLKEIAKISWDKIYNHKSVVQLEIAGFKVMSDLLGIFLPAILKNDLDDRDKKIMYLLPDQFKVSPISSELSPYSKTLLLLDYFSGMTDPYIIDLYRKLFGIEIPRHDG